MKPQAGSSNLALQHVDLSHLANLQRPIEITDINYGKKAQLPPGLRIFITSLKKFLNDERIHNNNIIQWLLVQNLLDFGAGERARFVRWLRIHDSDQALAIGKFVDLDRLNYSQRKPIIDFDLNEEHWPVTNNSQRIITSYILSPLTVEDQLRCLHHAPTQNHQHLAEEIG